MILAINTALSVHELALIDGDELLAERIWQDERDDIDRLIPTLEEMLEELGLEKAEIKEVLVVNGPGPFTALRTGVTFANALAEGLQAKLYAIDTFELLKRNAALTDPTLVVLNAGGLDVGIRFEDETKVGPLAQLLADFPHDQSIHVVSELKEVLAEELNPICLEKGWPQVKGHELQTLGESVLTFKLEDLAVKDTVEPIYLKEPVITKTSDPWKKP